MSLNNNNCTKQFMKINKHTKYSENTVSLKEIPMQIYTINAYQIIVGGKE